jgi:predicted PurR-regulated permease PerM
VTQRQLVGRTVTVIALVALAWLVVWIVRQITEILILLLVSAILASGFAPVVGVLQRWRIPGGLRLSRGVAILVLYMAIFATGLLLLSMILIPALNESSRFVQQLPQVLAKLRSWFLTLQAQWPWLPDIAGILDRLPQLATQLSRFGPQAAGVAFRFLGAVGAVITILVFTFYMLLEGAEIKRGFVALFPPPERSRIAVVLDRIGAKFGGWLRAQVVLSFSVAIPVAVGLLLLRMPYPFLLAIIAGIGEMIPMVGPTLGAAVAVLVALSQQAWQLAGVIIFYIIILNVEPHILVPRIMSQVVGMSPILTLVALLTGIQLLGIIGGLLAVPVAAALQVIAGEIADEVLWGSARPVTPVATPGHPADSAAREEPR